MKKIATTVFMYIKCIIMSNDGKLYLEAFIFESDLGKFRKQLLNQEININEDYCKVLQERFSHGTKLGKNIYVKYVKDDSVASLDYPDVPCYNNRDKKIYLNANMDLTNPRGAGVTWFHEHGHYIDASLGYVSDDDVFRNLLYEDVVRYRQNYGRKYHIDSLDMVDILINDKLNDMRLHSAISDLMEGITKGKITNVAGHGNNYWKQDNYAITREAFAHMFECLFDTERHKEIKKYFPESLDYFEKKLKTLKGK
ncbi:MAG: hypothetical protein LUH02_00215 [Erysipelotrichaceae bacterium]|nr:hypothetical protein [Erysipelotrichaceae bacterium]